MSETRNITTKIEVKGESEYKSAIKTVNSELKTLQSEMKRTESQFAGHLNSYEALSSKGATLEKMYAAQKEKLSTLREALAAAEKLAAEGISCEVVNVHTIKPIDREGVIAAAKKTGAVLTVENHNVIGGLHSAVLEALAEEKLPVCAVGVQDRFGEVGKMPYLREAMGLTVENIVATAKKAVALK